MASDNQSCLRFSVEESVWFQKGQEVLELVSITLDPDIVIQELDQYVSIRGALQLSGEYRIDDTRRTEEDTNDYTSVRVVNEVTTRDDGISELKHRFPVDVTIPKNRIQNLDEVYVAIESFDYELPKRGCLQLVADLSISGIYGSQQSVPSVESEQEAREEYEVVKKSSANNENQTDVEEEANTPVVEARETPTQEEQQEVVGYALEEANYVANARAEQPEGVVVEDEGDVQEQPISAGYDYNHNYEIEQTEDSDDDDLFSPFEVEGRKEAYHEDVDKEDVLAEVLKQPSPQIEMKGRVENNNSWTPHAKQEEEKGKEKVTANAREVHETDENQQQQAVTQKSENRLYLTKIFARDDEEDFTKMKICIVQQDDSLDSIAERYEVNVQQLLRVNQLDLNQDVSEGQLLYIPVPVNNK